MSLVFDERRVLSVGVQDASLEAVDEHFARFQKTDRRIRLFSKLRESLTALKKTGWQCKLIIDGSFVMQCVDQPEDIDLLLIMPADWDLDTALPIYQYNLVSKKRVRQEFGLDVFVVPAETPAEQKWINFFQQVNIKWCEKFGWPADSKKGIVGINL